MPERPLSASGTGGTWAPPHLVAGISEQLGGRQPADPCPDDDHSHRAGGAAQPVFGDFQQLLVVLVAETILGEPGEPLGAQERRQQEEREENWGGEGGR